jgi:SAM-dependent methyltransferase
MHDPAKYRPTERFSDRVADYARARPGYPPALVAWLLHEAGIARGAAVADLGSGTGLFARELLAAGCVVYAVEPNAAMRAAAEQALDGAPGLISIAGTAEQTGLAERSVALVTAAQAYHWFEPDAARDEVRRILVPDGCAALIWNVRSLVSAFARDYETLLLEYCPDYAAGQPHQASQAEIAAFFGREALRAARFDYVQRLNYEALEARLLSSSYTPKADDRLRTPLLAALRELFERHSQDGIVRFEYDSQIFLGRP